MMIKGHQGKFYLAFFATDYLWRDEFALHRESPQTPVRTPELLLMEYLIASNIM